MCCLYKIAGSTGEELQPIISLWTCSFLVMVGVVPQQEGRPAKMLNLEWRGYHSGCKKRLKSFAAQAALEFFPGPWIIPNDSEEVLSALQSRPSSLCNVILRHWEKPKKKGVGQKFLPLQWSAYILHIRFDYPYLFLHNYKCYDWT